MVYFWGAAAAIAVKMDRLRSVEQALLDLALARWTAPIKASGAATSHRGAPKVRIIDTKIPASVVPVSGQACCLTGTIGEVSSSKDDYYIIHGIEVTSDSETPSSSGNDKPLVLLHGYST